MRARAAQPSPVLHPPTLAALYPDAAHRRRMLAWALAYTRQDRNEIQRCLAAGQYDIARSCLHRIKGAVCLLCRDGPGYRLFDRADQAMLVADVGEVNRRMAPLTGYLDSFEAALEAETHAPQENAGTGESHSLERVRSQICKTSIDTGLEKK
jgi:hypothetical protein